MKDGKKRSAAVRLTHFELGGEQFALLTHPHAAGGDDGGLTAAEREVAALLLAGGSNAEIAQARRTSVHTVANQLAAIFRKLDVRSRFELIARLRATRGGGS